MSANDEMRKRATEAAISADAAYWSSENLTLLDVLVQTLVDFAAQEISLARTEGAKQEREAIYEHLVLLVGSVDGFDITYFDIIADFQEWLRERGDEKEGKGKG